MKRNIVLWLLVLCVAATPLFAAKAKTTVSVKTRVYNDATSLAALLNDAQTPVTISADYWKTIANEANSLANRLYGATSGNATARAAARDLRTHVQEFRKAALGA